MKRTNFDSLRFTLMKIHSAARIILYNKFYKMHISFSAIISPFSFIDKTNAAGIYIGDKTFITRGVVILSHDFCRSISCITKIGKNVFIGVNSVVLPGITIGDNVVIGSGSVISKDIPGNCIAAGNPCQVIKSNVAIEDYGVIKE